jgi:hypothetical protein
VAPDREKHPSQRVPRWQSGEALWTLGVMTLAWGVVLAVAALDPSTCVRDDMAAQYLGASREVWLAARQGRLALLTPHSWFGGALAGEYQHGVFSVFAVGAHVAAWTIGRSLHGTAAVLVAIPVGWLAAGTFRLARAEGCSTGVSVLASALATFHGWTFRWAVPWYPGLSSFAWIPWLLWAVRRGGRSRMFLVATTVYAIAAGGWPFTVLMGFVAVGWMLAIEVRRTRSVRSAAEVLGGACLGLCLAAPALLMLAEYGAACERASEYGADSRWVVPIAALPGLLSPAWRSMWSVFEARTVRPAPELFSLVGLSVLAAALTDGTTRGPAVRSAAPWAILALASMFFGCLPSLLPFRWSFRWLPLWHLAMALAAARATEQQAPRSLPRRSWLPTSGFIALVGVVAVSIAGLTSSEGSRRPDVMLVPLLAVPMTGAWWLAGHLGGRRLDAWCASVAAIAGLFLTLSTTRSSDIATWPLPERLASAGGIDPSRTYLAVDVARDIETATARSAEWFRLGNQPMLAGLSFVNGYSPMRPSVVTNRVPLALHGWIRGGENTGPTLSALLRDPASLDDLGIDGLVLATWAERALSDGLIAHGWFRRASFDAGSVYERGAEATPRAWLVDAETADDVHPRRLADSRIRLYESDTEATAILEEPVDRPALLVFKRAAYPGYRGSVNAVERTTIPYRGTLVAVPVAAGTQGAIRVAYRPRSLVAGEAVAGFGFLVLVICGAVAVQRRTRSPFFDVSSPAHERSAFHDG